MLSRIHPVPADTSFPPQRSCHFANTDMQTQTGRLIQSQPIQPLPLFGSAGAYEREVALAGSSPSTPLSSKIYEIPEQSARVGKGEGPSTAPARRNRYPREVSHNTKGRCNIWQKKE